MTPELIRTNSNFNKMAGLARLNTNFNKSPSVKITEISPHHDHVCGWACRNQQGVDQTPRKRGAFVLPEKKESKRIFGRARFELGAGMGGRLAERLRGRD
jgi:hypothetical protein